MSASDRALELHADGLSLRKIAAILAAEGYQTPRGGPWWSHTVDLLVHPERRKKSPEAIRREYLGRYGLTVDSFARLLESQGGVCAICGSDMTGFRDRHIDHDHACCPGYRSCGRCVRGILCGFCNMGLGRFRDNGIYLRSAIDYLERHRVSIAA